MESNYHPWINHEFSSRVFQISVIAFLRFGLIGGVVAKRDIKMGEELSIAYGYPLEKCPRWYSELYKKEFPSEDVRKEGGGNENKENLKGTRVIFR